MIKILSLLLILQSIIPSCTTTPKKTISHSNEDTLPKLKSEQQIAFDALNSIQTQGRHLYSTFPGIDHDCIPPDTSFVITQVELRIALEELLTRYYTHIEIEERTKLANEAALAQEQYVVLQCNGQLSDSTKKFPTSGLWILQNVLERRDILIEW